MSPLPAQKNKLTMFVYNKSKKNIINLIILFITSWFSVGFAAEETLDAETVENLKQIVLQNAENFISNKLAINEYESFNKTNVSVVVIPEKVGTKTADNFKTSYGSFDKDVESLKTMKVSVKSLGDLPYCGLEFFWVIRDESTKKTYLERPDPVLLFGGKREARFSRTSVRSDTRYVTLGIREKDGEKITGWLARCILLFNGKIIGVKASSQDLERLGKRGGIIGTGEQN